MHREHSTGGKPVKWQLRLSRARGLALRRSSRQGNVKPPPDHHRIAVCRAWRAPNDPQHGACQGRAIVTRRKVAGMDVRPLFGLRFWLSNKVSSSFCRSLARPSFCAASNAFIVGP